MLTVLLGSIPYEMGLWSPRETVPSLVGLHLWGFTYGASYLVGKLDLKQERRRHISRLQVAGCLGPSPGLACESLSIGCWWCHVNRRMNQESRDKKKHCSCLLPLSVIRTLTLCSCYSSSQILLWEAKIKIKCVFIKRTKD